LARNVDPQSSARIAVSTSTVPSCRCLNLFGWKGCRPFSSLSFIISIKFDSLIIYSIPLYFSFPNNQSFQTHLFIIRYLTHLIHFLTAIYLLRIFSYYNINFYILNEFKIKPFISTHHKLHLNSLLIHLNS
jgi:hypothetical protein